MPKPKVSTKAPDDPNLPARPDGRTAKGTWAKGVSGRTGNDAARARRTLNKITIEAMTEAFVKGGRKAINECMTKQPATFLKLLVLLVPRELEVTHSQGVKAMSDEQIDQAIEAIQEMLEKRADNAKIIEGEATPIPSREEEESA